MILVSKFMVHRALSDKKYLSLGLLSPLIFMGNFQKNHEKFIKYQTKLKNRTQNVLLDQPHEGYQQTTQHRVKGLLFLFTVFIQNIWADKLSK